MYPLSLKKESIPAQHMAPVLIPAIIFLLCILVYPLGLFGHASYTSASLDKGLFNNIDLTDGSLARGQFYPSRKNLEALSFKFGVSGQAGRGYMLLELFDSGQDLVYSVSLDCGDILNNRFVSFPVNMVLDTDDFYYYQISAHDYGETFINLYMGSSSIGPSESAEFYYNGSPVPGMTPAVIYEYIDRADFSHALPYYFCFAVLGFFLCVISRKFKNAKEEI